MPSTESLDQESCYRAVKSRDRRFDGVFYVGVRTTGIYCRPSCPARTPKFENVAFHLTPASAQAGGFRACKRCLPDATPGSPDWDVAATAAGRAMRLIADGVVDREGVEGLASRVGYTPRHLSRLLTHELGAGPLALARAQRAQTARVLLETSDLSCTDVAFAAGFSSVRQFNATVQEVYAANPSTLRGRRAGHSSPGVVRVRLAVRSPFAGAALLDFLAAHLVVGIEDCGPGWYSRTLALPHGDGVMRLEIPDAPHSGETVFVGATFTLDDLRDTTAATQRARRLLDADCDPVAVLESFFGDPVLGALARRTPGLRVPGHVDGVELAVRAVVGQQVSMAAAHTVLGRLVAAYGRPLCEPTGTLTHLFPTAEALVAIDPETLPMPRARGRALVGLCAALASGDVALDRGADRDVVRSSLLSLKGIGPWTADYIAMRALADPDVFLPTDIGVRDALRGLGIDPTGGPAEMRPAVLAERWRPWRSYALMHLWRTVIPTSPRTDPEPHESAAPEET